MADRLSRFGFQNRYLLAILGVGFLLMVFGIWVREPHVMGPDEKAAVTKSLWLGVNRTPFIPDFTKGGKLYIYMLAVSFSPLYGYLKLTGQTSTLAEQATGASTFFEASPELKQAFYDFLLVGRFVSVLIGVVTLYLVYYLGRIQYDKRRGLLASGVLAVGMGFVNMAHVATEDMLLTGLFVLTFVLFAEYERSSDDRFLRASAVTSGLTVSTKMTAGFLVFPLIYFSLREHYGTIFTGDDPAAFEAILRVGRSGLLSLGAYLVTTPAIFVYPNLYMMELFGESAAAFSQQAAYPGWILQTLNAARAFGLPLFLLCLIGVWHLALRLRRDEVTNTERAILLFAIPYFLVVGSWQTSEMWYMIVLMPFLALLAAEGISWSSAWFPRRVVLTLVAAVFLFSAIYTGITVQQIATDARVDSAKWIDENVEAGDSIDTHQYPLHLPALPEQAEVDQYWFNTSDDANFDRATRRVSCAKPEYIVLASNQYGGFLRSPNADPEAATFYRRLLSGKSNYEVAKRFGPPLPPSNSLQRKLWLTIKPKTITNHEIQIAVLRRTNPATASC